MTKLPLNDNSSVYDSPSLDAHDKSECPSGFCELCIDDEPVSDSGSEYDPENFKLTVYHYTVTVTEFLSVAYTSIPTFSGKAHEITCAFLDLVEQEWAEYAHLQPHWVAKLRVSHLADEALKVANDFPGYDWDQFRKYMEKWFPSFSARMQMRYRMVDAQNYLVNLDMRQAVAQAWHDYRAQDDEYNKYDAPEPAGILAKRIPKDICTKYEFVALQCTSGRDILQRIENIVWKEKVCCGSTAKWLGPVTKQVSPTLESIAHAELELAPASTTAATAPMLTAPAPTLNPMPVPAQLPQEPHMPAKNPRGNRSGNYIEYLNSKWLNE